MFSRDFHLLQDDISSGVKSSLQSCPIALCLIRELKLDRFKVIVYGDIAFVRTDDDVDSSCLHHWLKIDLPEDVQAFIKSFDNGLEVEPLNFCINLPDGLEKRAEHLVNQ